MTKDLEETLSTLDGAHREMVVRMRACFAPAPAFAVRRRQSCGALAAAALVAVAACGIVASLWHGQSPASPHPSAFRLASVGDAAAVPAGLHPFFRARGRTVEPAVRLAARDLGGAARTGGHLLLLQGVLFL